VDAVAAKESRDGMLRGPGFSHELPQRKTSRSEYKPSIGGPSSGRLLSVILDRSGVSENTHILTFLCTSLNLFTDKDEGRHGFDGATQQKPPRVFTAWRTIRS
jgi:hypothetical protein